VNVDLLAYPLLSAFREQAKVATVVKENGNFVTMQTLGEEVYRDVFERGVAPAEAVTRFVEAVNAQGAAK
jgi:hypothetical protein